MVRVHAGPLKNRVRVRAGEEEKHFTLHTDTSRCKYGGLAQLARALDLHSRGHRFDSDILHGKKLRAASHKLQAEAKKKETLNKMCSAEVLKG